MTVLADIGGTGYILASIGEAVALVLVLAIALTFIRKRLTTISEGLGTLGGALATVESQHLRPLFKLVNDINARFTVIVPTIKGIAAKAALVVKMAGS